MADSNMDFENAANLSEKDVKNVEIDHWLPEQDLHSLLLSNLSSFTYKGPFKSELLLQVDSPIPHISLFSMEPSTDVFAQILWKIQTGALKKLSMSYKNVPWNGYTVIMSDYEGQLPKERPLLIFNGDLRWFLHRDGAVMLCKHDSFGYGHVDISKCQPADFPGVLRTKETVHKELAQKDSSIRCLRSHFLSFFNGIHEVKASQKGAFPKSRPLVCKSDEKKYIISCYLLNNDGTVDSYFWNGMAHFDEKSDMEKTWPSDIIDHTPLQKFVFDQRITKRSMDEFRCRDEKEFLFLFNSYKPLPRDFSGRLPEHRPLVFKGTLSDEESYDCMCRDVLYDDGTLIRYTCEIDKPANAYGVKCPAWCYPSALITPEIVHKIIIKAPFKKFAFDIDLDIFRDGFRSIRTLPFQAYGDLREDEYPVAFKKITFDCDEDEVIDQRWVFFESGEVRKCEWKGGWATFSKGVPEEYPPILTKTLIKNFFKGVKFAKDSDLVVDRDVLNEYLKEFEIRRYKYSRPFSDDDLPLIFKKKQKIKHACVDECDCLEKTLHLWVVAEDCTLTHAVWGEDRHLVFYEGSKVEKVPPMLRTKETLDYLLHKTGPGTIPLYWYGSLEDFLSYFEGHMPLEFNHDGPLSDKRPLVFKKKDESSGFWFLRRDRVSIECNWMKSFVKLSIASKYSLPAALRREISP